ncbi:MAG: hypothetical protein GC160_21990 [Acidobacteria bacterium]|nr:hypothetical protein [Acidobacteriota bacterium]
MARRSRIARLTLAACALAGLASGGVHYLRPTAIFVFDEHPDLPLAEFASGNLGLIQPSWARSHLYAAYRRMENVAFTPGERQAYLDYVRERLGEEPRSTGGPDRYVALRESLGIPWQPQTAAGAPALGMSSDFTYSLLCVDDAFDLATKTLQERVDRFGIDSPQLQEWVIGQDAVFENCFNREAKVLPPAVVAGADPLIRADRDYQRAAALFYSLRFDEARAAFQRIARDADSPWRVWGTYLAGRAQLWKARFLDGRSNAYSPALRLAEADFRAVLADDSLREAHDAARYLLARILFRLRPSDAAALLAPRLLTPLGESNRKRQLRLFTELLDDAAYESTTAELRPAHDLVDWIFAFQSGDPAETDHAVARWKETSSVAWLTAALSKVPGDHPDVPAMLTQAVEIGEHPATPTLLYHQARILAERGELDLARGVLDRLIPRLEGLPSAQNRASDLRARWARGFKDFLANGVRRPALVSSVYFQPNVYDPPWRSQEEWFEWTPERQRAWLDSTRDQLRLTPATARLLNTQVPVRTLALLPRQPELPDPVKAQLLGAAWARAAALDQWGLAAEIAPELGRLEPSLLEEMTAFAEAPTESRRFAGILTLLRTPGLSVKLWSGPLRAAALSESDPRGLNWWWVEAEEPAEPDQDADFVNAAQREQARKEWETIRQRGDAYDWLLREVEEQARAPRPDPGVPEALYRLTVCYQGVDLQWGYDPRPSFDPERPLRLLEFRFGNTDWARRARRELER